MTNIFNMLSDIDMNVVKANLEKTDATHNAYRFSHCIDRNILLIGRSCTDKSTVAKVIENILYRPDTLSLYSETKDVEFHKVSTDIKDETRLYFNVVDTPGFFMQATTSPAHQSNEQIKRVVNNCMEHDVTNVHLFAFVFSINSGINQQDIATMKYVKQNYPALGKYMALLVTHCEALGQEQRKKLIDQFFEHHEVKASKLDESFQQGVFFMGCLRYESDEQKNDKAIYAQYKNILEMRKTFIEKCIQQEETYNFYKEATSCTIL